MATPLRTQSLTKAGVRSVRFSGGVTDHRNIDLVEIVERQKVTAFLVGLVTLSAVVAFDPRRHSSGKKMALSQDRPRSSTNACQSPVERSPSCTILAKASIFALIFRLARSAATRLTSK